MSTQYECFRNKESSNFVKSLKMLSDKDRLDALWLPRKTALIKQKHKDSAPCGSAWADH